MDENQVREQAEAVLDPDWLKTATKEQISPDQAGEMVRFLVVSIAKALTMFMTDEDSEPDDYQVGQHNAAVEIADLIGEVMSGNDPMEVRQMSPDELFAIIQSL
jgi:hypothetical protein